MLREKRDLAKNVHRLARLGVRLMGFKDGGIVMMNEFESTLVLEVKDKQEQDSIFLELEANVRKKKELFLNKGEMLS